MHQSNLLAFVVTTLTAGLFSAAAGAAVNAPVPLPPPASGPAATVPASDDVKAVGLGKRAESPSIKAYIELQTKVHLKELQDKLSGPSQGSGASAPSLQPDSVPAVAPTLPSAVPSAPSAAAQGMKPPQGGARALLATRPPGAAVPPSMDDPRQRLNEVRWLRSVIAGGLARADIVDRGTTRTVKEGDTLNGWTVQEISARGVKVVQRRLTGDGPGRLQDSYVLAPYVAPPMLAMPGNGPTAEPARGAPAVVGAQPPALPTQLRPDSTSFQNSPALPAR